MVFIHTYWALLIEFEYSWFQIQELTFIIIFNNFRSNIQKKIILNIKENYSLFQLCVFCIYFSKQKCKTALWVPKFCLDWRKFHVKLTIILFKFYIFKIFHVSYTSLLIYYVWYYNILMTLYSFKSIYFYALYL